MTFINGDTVDPNPGDDMGPGIIQDGSITFSTGGLNGGLLGSLISPVDAWFQEGCPIFLIVITFGLLSMAPPTIPSFSLKELILRKLSVWP